MKYINISYKKCTIARDDDDREGCKRVELVFVVELGGKSSTFSAVACHDSFLFSSCTKIRYGSFHKLVIKYIMMNHECKLDENLHEKIWKMLTWHDPSDLTWPPWPYMKNVKNVNWTWPPDLTWPSADLTMYLVLDSKL